MDWGIIAQLIVQVGLPAVEKIIANWQNKAPVTVEEFQAVRALAVQNTARARMIYSLQAAGIPLDSPQAKALLALTDAPSVPGP